MMTRLLLGTMILLGFAATPALANLKYYSDPVYKKFSDEDQPAMSDMMDLAKQGDPRAQFILGDMYEKGKGGLPKDLKQSRHWFEESAMHGYGQSFIRLAALAKHEGNQAEAWQWYTLAIDGLDNDDTQQYAVQARQDLTDTAKLSSEDISKARKSMSAWKDGRDTHLREEAASEKEAIADAEKKEKEDKDKVANKQQEKEKEPDNEQN